MNQKINAIRTCSSRKAELLSKFTSFLPLKFEYANQIFLSKLVNNSDTYQWINLLFSILKLLFRRVTRGTGERGRPRLPYFENRKKVFWLWEECPDCVHLWMKFSIQKVVLREFRRKNSQIFWCGTFFLVFLTKCF